MGTCEHDDVVHKLDQASLDKGRAKLLPHGGQYRPLVRVAAQLVLKILRYPGNHKIEHQMSRQELHRTSRNHPGSACTLLSKFPGCSNVLQAQAEIDFTL